jgi:Fe-S cluster assembly ATP-binding protein
VRVKSPQILGKETDFVGLLKLENLHVALEDGTAIVKGVDLEVDVNEVHAVMGPNGSGKSTLSYAIMGHPAYEITEGRILLDGENVTELAANERAQRGLFLAFQYPHAIPGVTVTSFMRSAINSVRKARNGGVDSPIPIPEFRTELLAQMDRLKVSRELASRYINDGFSGGEKKRVEILQMAMLKPLTTCTSSSTGVSSSQAARSSRSSSRPTGTTLSFRQQRWGVRPNGADRD